MLLGAHDDAEVQFYSVPRRYNEFLALYTQVRALVGTSGGQAIDQMPLFPSKELMSPTILGLLWRSTTSIVVLEERRQQFEALLQWIERHPVARTSSAFQEFLGQPPETQDGYVSLKEYSSPHWLSALHQQLAKDREFRRRRRSSAGSATSTASSTPRAGSVRVLQMETATGPPPHQRRAVAHKENRKAELDRLRRKTRRQSKKPTCIARRRRGNTFVKLV
ncbi:TPA: hypothetical protein N0F65_007233 [Lagenidium giganteum]|uniref:PX domain-containing protein n=1 Tax=Lagenidium giganteum TaxID=4803 RepID=A0AAV2ZAK8_9STRA|nr:TPA: hypothetical protein N0F65_007233 [Lagenidium giganteum]